MMTLISDTAKWGALTVGPQIINTQTRKRMRRVLREIRSGKFAREFIREMQTGGKRYRKLLREIEEHPIENIGRKLRALTDWRKT